MILTDESGTLKCRASTFTMAALASPLTGGSLTQILKLVSLSFLTLSSLELGFAVTKIFINIIVTAFSNKIKSILLLLIYFLVDYFFKIDQKIRKWHACKSFMDLHPIVTHQTNTICSKIIYFPFSIRMMQFII